MKQLELFDLTVIENSSNASGNSLTHWEHENQNNKIDEYRRDDSPERETDDQELFDNSNNLTELSVSEYKPGGTAAKTNKYYRFSYRRNGKVKHIHIKGGNTGNNVAIERKEQIERWILQHIPLEDIIERIKQW